MGNEEAENMMRELSKDEIITERLLQVDEFDEDEEHDSNDSDDESNGYNFSYGYGNYMNFRQQDDDDSDDEKENNHSGLDRKTKRNLFLSFAVN